LAAARSDGQGVVRFGVFEVDLSTGELRKGGLRQRLQAQPFQILAALLERPGELVSRDDLRTRIWPEAVFVDFEHGLHKAMNRLRVALGDSANTPRFVETLSRRGYRFIAPVEGHRAKGTGGLHIWFESRAFPLQEGGNLLGRDERADIPLDSISVSRRHARIEVRQGRAVLEDLGSRNGTWVGGRRVGQPVDLLDGDDIRVGVLHLTFRNPEPRGSIDTGDTPPGGPEK
jgi:DNA-binding winged helix-turn-helix (wHTH) protein